MDTKIDFIEFNSFSRFSNKNIKIEPGTNICTFVGPNGSGKSSILESFALILQFISEFDCSVDRSNIIKSLKVNRTTKPQWTSARICLSKKDNFDISLGKSFTNIIDLNKFKTITFIVSQHLENNSLFSITKFLLDDNEFNIDISIPYTITKRKKVLDAQITTLQSEITSREEAIKQKNIEIQKYRNNPQLVQQHSKEVEKLTQELKPIKTTNESKIKKIQEEINTEIHLTDGNKIFVHDFEAILTSINIPKVLYMHQNSTIESKIDDLINDLKLKKDAPGSHKDGSEYKLLLEGIMNLLNVELDCGLIKDKFIVSIDNLNLDQLSTGTYLSFAFFAISKLIPENSIVIWDEPENSFHPTRRLKMLNLMQNNTRLFLLGTHTTEFAPVLDSTCNIYKLSSYFKDGLQNPICSITEAKGLLDAFKISSSLGFEPSKLLFTSNCIIWVEGPSDLIYYRYWLKNYIETNSENPNNYIVEGFDYTFMLSGGSLIANIDASEDYENMERNWINILSITPSSIFICDTDLNQDEASTITNVNDNNSFQYYKKRIQKIKSTFDQLEKAENYSKILMTYGRETENFIPNNIFHGILKELYNIGDSDEQSNSFIESIIISRWDSYDEKIIKLLSDSRIDKFINPKTKKIKYGDLISNKVEFALKYVNYSKEITSPVIFDNYNIIKNIYDTILNVKKSYLQ